MSRLSVPLLRSALRSVPLFAVSSFLLLALPAFAEETPVHLRIAGREARLDPPAVREGKEIYAPVAVLNEVGANYRRSQEKDSVLVVTGRGDAEIAVARIKGADMIALSDAARALNAVVASDEAKPDTVYFLARIVNVRFQDGALRVTTSFPVPYSARAIADGTIPRSYLDCVGAYVPPDFQCDSLPNGERRVTRLRAGQPTSETARIVAETATGQSFTDLEVRSNNRTTIAALLSTSGAATGIHKFADAGQRAVVPTPQTTAPPTPTKAATPAPAATTPPTTGATPLSRSTAPSRSARRFPTGAPIFITGISIELEDDSRVRITLSTTGKAAAYVHYQDGTRKLAMDIPNALLKLTNGDDAEQTRTHPLLTALHASLAQDAPPMTRIALDTTRVVGFSVSAEANNLTLELRLPRSATGVLADKTIVVDAGHGGSSTGALGHGPNGITYEKNCTLAISLKLRDLLEAAGVRVVMARDKDVDVDLYDRPKLANNIKADLFVSIHNDSNGVPNSTSGTTTYYHMNDPSSRALAACIQEQVVAVSGLPSHGARSDGTLYAHGLAVLRMTTMPAVLCEVAFINNSRDRACLTDPDFQQRVAQALFNGLKNYVEGVQKTALRLPTPQTIPAGFDAAPEE